MTLEIAEIAERQAWDAALLALPQPHILQSWAWGETKAQTGWRARRLLWSSDAAEGLDVGDASAESACRTASCW